MTGQPKGWRIWAVVPGEWVLRGIYIGQLWMTPTLTAKCLDTPRHQPLDPSCAAGVYTFAHLEDALQEAVVLKAFAPTWAPATDPAKIVFVLGSVELTGTITEVREDRLCASWDAGEEFPLELRGQAAAIQSLLLFENWLDESDRDRDRLLDTLSRRYAPVHVVDAEDALPDLNRLRELKVRLQQQGQGWLSVVRTVSAEGRIRRKDLRRLSRVILSEV